MNVYRDQAPNLIHLGEEGQAKTICKHYRVQRMERLYGPQDAGRTAWCRDCYMAFVRNNRKEQDERTEA